MFIIAFETDELPPIYFEQHPNTWTHNRATARQFATAQAAADFARAHHLTDGALVERV